MSGGTSWQEPAVQQREVNFESFEEGWEAIQQGLDRMETSADSDFKRNLFPPSDYSRIYSIIYNLSTKRATSETSGPVGRRPGGSRRGGPAKMGMPRGDRAEKTPQDKLYEKYHLWLRNYLETRVVGAIREKHGVELLMELVRRWENHKIIVRWLMKLFAYLDRYHTTQGGVQSLKVVGLSLFHEKVFQDVRREVLDAVLDKIEEERNGMIVDKAALKVAIEVFVEMGLEEKGGSDVKKVYKPEFEAPLIVCTRRFYSVECSRWFETDSAPEYLRKAEARLQEEDQRVNQYLNPSSRSLLIRTVEDELLKKHQETLLHMPNSGFVCQLRNLNRENLGLMFRMFHRLPSDASSGIRPMADLFRDEIVAEGRARIAAVEQEQNADQIVFVLDLLRMQSVYLDLVRDQFENSNIFHKAMREGFERFINVQVTIRSTRLFIAEVLSNFTDAMLKSTREKYTDEDIDSLFDKLVHLFQFVHDKDFFHDKYRKLLAQRLLDSNVKENDERIIISKLKMKHGAAFTSKLETMITDRNVSFEQMNDFKKWARTADVHLPIKEFQAFVLTTGSWPHYPVDNMFPPEELAASMRAFKQFYDTRTKNRILQWIHSLAKATLRARFACGLRSMNMSGYQAAICLLFNSHQELTVSKTFELLGLPPSDAKRAIMGLAAGRRKVLLRSGSGKSLNKSETLIFNEQLSEQKKHFDVPIPKVAATSKAGPSASVSSETEMERRHMIDACIVRTMKARRRLNHAELVAEALSQLNLFRPEPRLIKTRIEDLISREFLKRDEVDNQLYHYVA